MAGRLMLARVQVDPAVLDLDARRATAGISVREMCRRAGANQSTWFKWKAGKFSPGLRQLRRLELAVGLGAPADEALTHREAVAAITGCAAAVTPLAYEAAIRAYFRLRQLAIPADMQEAD